MKTWGLVLPLAGVMAGSAFLLQRPHARPPLNRAYWYWHHPFRLSASDQATLDRIHVSRLYVHAGTVERGPEGLRISSQQEWLAQPKCELEAVVRVHPAANDALFAARLPELRDLISGLHLPKAVRVLQWDLDAPTRALPRYTAFLRKCRDALPIGMRLGATGLPTWIGSPGYPALCDALDEISPQFYGNRLPEAGSTPPPLWETRNLTELASRAAAGRARVWIGLPAYGRCLVMDPHRLLTGVRHDLDANTLLDDPAWELVSASTRRTGTTPVEDTLVLRSRTETSLGGADAPTGTQLWFQWPRTDGLKSWIDTSCAKLPDAVTGVCYFRWPTPGEPLAVPPLRPGPPYVDFRTGRNGMKVRVLPGEAGPTLGEDMQLTVEAPGLEAASISPLQWLRDREPTSPLRADRVRVTRPALPPGEVWDALEIRKPSSQPVPIRLRWKDAAGVWQETLTGVSWRRQ